MFERAMERAAQHARRRAELRASRLADRLADALPSGIGAEATPEGVELSGRRLRQRFALDPRLRWLVAELVR
jgi:hypothetical protein